MGRIVRDALGGRDNPRMPQLHRGAAASSTVRSSVRPGLTRPVVLLAVVGAAGCTPALDWREVRPPDSSVVLLMPCKPVEQTRRVALAGAPVRMSMHVCNAGGLTWALTWAETGDPTRVGPSLRALRAAAAANIGAEASAGAAASRTVPGSTPNADSAWLGLQGRLPDGAPVQQRGAVFAYGTRVVQATVLGPALPPAAVETFLGSLRVVP
jgi:hypothetical protein